jgi:hypothetical protein
MVFDARTGAELYKARVGGAGNTFSASPWAVNGKVFFLSEDGVTFGIEAGDKYVEIAKIDLGEMSLATPALAPDALFIRTMTKLYRIAGKQASKAIDQAKGPGPIPGRRGADWLLLISKASMVD